MRRFWMSAAATARLHRNLLGVEAEQQLLFELGLGRRQGGIGNLAMTARSPSA
jgi:hypothetical protein